MTRAFGSSIERLREIGSRHGVDMAAAELVAARPLANDPSVSLDEMTAFLRFRAVAALMAACEGDSGRFRAALSEARRLDQAGLL